MEKGKVMWPSQEKSFGTPAQYNVALNMRTCNKAEKKKEKNKSFRF